MAEGDLAIQKIYNRLRAIDQLLDHDSDEAAVKLNELIADLENEGYGLTED